VGEILWPIHPRPFRGELLSSWISRSALTHGQIPYTFLRLTVRDADTWKNDIDIFCPKQIVEKLSSKTGLSPQVIQKLTFYNDADLLYENRKMAVQIKWILPLRLRRPNDPRPALQMCPSCLKEAKHPHFLKVWRLAFYTSCLVHRRLLHDHCPSCGSSINLRKVHTTALVHKQSQGIALCAACGFDFRKAPMQTAPEDLIRMTRRCIHFYQNGYGSLGKEHIPYSHLFFEGMRVLCSFLAYRKAGEQFYELIANKLGLNPDHTYRNSNEHSEVELLPASLRVDCLRMLNWLFEDWPNRIIETCKLAHVPANSIIMTKDARPHWLSKVIRLNLLSPYYQPSVAEVTSVISFLRRNQTVLSRKIYGETIGPGKYSRLFPMIQKTT